MLTLKQVTEYEYAPPRHKYGGPTTYFEKEIAPWNHPATLANKILSRIQHTVVYGVMLIGPIGHGKSAMARALAHHIHTKDTRFQVSWVGAYEFTHQEQFYESLPKGVPRIIIFDDISSALKKTSEKEIAANFSSLTRIREFLDPIDKRCPAVVMPIFHYSKNLEKEFRAQLGMSIFLSFGNEERTNIDTIAPKNSQARKALEDYSTLYTSMLDQHKFSLRLGNGKKLEYETDNPFRAACAISNHDGKLVVYSHKDCCDLCVEKKLRRKVPASQIYDEVKKAHGKYGIQALRHCLYKKGFKLAIHPRVAVAQDFIDQNILSRYDTDFDELVSYIYNQSHTKQPKRVYHKRKQESEILERLEDSSEIIEEQ